MTRHVLPVLLLGLLVLGGCGGGQSLPEGGPADAAESGTGGSANAGAPAGLAGLADVLPAPAELPRTASGPPSNVQRLASGSSFAGGVLPYNRFNGGVFSPEWTPGGSHPISDAAYAGYILYNMDGYTGLGRVKLKWQTPPDPENTYVGVANNSRNRWDWFQADEQFDIHFPSYTPYVSDAGAMAIMVVLLGSGTAHELDWLLAGDSFVYATFLSNIEDDPLLNVAPFDLELDGTTSVSFGSEVVSWDFDWQSDGEWDVVGDTDGMITQQYNYGTWTVTMRAHDAEGAYADKSQEFVAINPSNEPPDAFFEASVTSGSAPLEVVFDASGSSDPDGTIVRYEWDFNGDDIYEYNYEDGTSEQTYIFGRKGLNLAHLRVTDNDLATATYAVGIFLDNGWRTTTIFSNDDYIIDLTAAVIGTDVKVPCVAFQTDFESEDTHLRFARASLSDGSDWSAAVEPYDSTGEAPGFSPSIVALAGSGAPLIAYGVLSNGYTVHTLEAVSATDENCSTWNDPVKVSGDEPAGDQNYLTLINAIPSIVSECGLGLNERHLRYYQAQNIDGSSWHPAQLVTQPGDNEDYYTVAMGTYGTGLLKKPMIVYMCNNFFDGTFAAVKRATAFDGTAWESQSIVDGLGSNGVYLSTADGAPALIGGDEANTGKVMFTRATDVNAASWDPAIEAGKGNYMDVAVLNGMPCIASSPSSGNKLYFVTATDAQGSGWNEPYLVDPTPSAGNHCQLVVVDNMPVICYVDTQSKSLKAAYWEE